MQRFLDTLVLFVLGSCGLVLTWLNWDAGPSRSRAGDWFKSDRPAPTADTAYVYVPPAAYTVQPGAPAPRPSVDVRGHVQPATTTRAYLDAQALQRPNARDAELRQRLTQVLLHEAPQTPPAQTAALVDGYVRYRRESREIAAEQAAGKRTGRLADAIEGLRVRVFGDTAAELFADGTSDVILDDPSLPLALREARIRAVIGTGALTLADARKVEIEVAALNHEEARVRAAGGTPDQVARLRARMVGGDAADRLAQLDATTP